MVPNLVKRVIVRFPDATTKKYLGRGQVDIEARCMSILACGMAELTADVLLVWSLVPGKTCIPVNPEHRAAIAAGIGYIGIREGRQKFPDHFDKAGNRCHDKTLIAILVVAKPFPVIVASQVREKPEHLLWKSIESCVHCNILCRKQHGVNGRSASTAHCACIRLSPESSHSGSQVLYVFAVIFCKVRALHLISAIFPSVS